MGLDTTVLTHPSFYRTDEGASDDDMDRLHDEYTHVYVNPHFLEHAEGYPAGFYDGQTAEGFHFSYSGYSMIRASISNIAFGVEPAIVWDRFDEYRDTALGWFIHFSDCEGMIGPHTSAIIAAGFDAMMQRHTYEDRAKRESFWFAEGAQSIRDTFTLAAYTNGFVLYH